MKSAKIKGVVHRVFVDYNEFDTYHKDLGIETPEVRDWRKTSEEGQWVEADDGGIVQVLKYSPKIKHNRDTKKKSVVQGWLRTVVGTFVISKYQGMDSQLDGRDRYRFNGKSKTEYLRNRRDREKCSKQEEMFSVLLATQHDVKESYINVYGIKSEDVMNHEINFLLTRERIVKKVRDIVVQSAKELGLDHDWVLRNLKRLGEEAEDEPTQLKSILRVGETLNTFEKDDGNGKSRDGILFGKSEDVLMDKFDEDDKLMSDIAKEEERMKKLESSDE